MSTINSIHQKMTETVAAAIPSYLKLPNPYNTQENMEAFLKSGFGVTIGQASNERAVSGALMFRRSFDFVLTKKAYFKESDTAAKAAAELQLMNDQLTVLKAFELDFTLTGSVLRISYESDSGVSFVINDQTQFLELKTTVSVLYIESVT